jgi:hypothetical protein
MRLDPHVRKVGISDSSRFLGHMDYFWIARHLGMMDKSFGDPKLLGDAKSVIDTFAGQAGGTFAGQMEQAPSCRAKELSLPLVIAPSGPSTLCHNR